MFRINDEIEMLKRLIFIILGMMILLLQACPVIADMYENIPLLEAPIDPHDLPSLQRGAKMFINYCSSCHSLTFMRYNRMARDIGVLKPDGTLDEQLVKDSFIFTGARISDTLQIAMKKEEAKKWFGVTPPDLSVIAKARGVDWLYTYLLSFYQDKARPFGVNNLVFNETAMPDVLVNLRGTQIPIYGMKTIWMDGKPQNIKVIEHLLLVDPGTMQTSQFKTAVADLVNFLAYVSDPVKNQRQQLGWWVLGYLIIFAGLAYLLKKVYWKRIK